MKRLLTLVGYAVLLTLPTLWLLGKCDGARSDTPQVAKTEKAKPKYDAGHIRPVTEKAALLADIANMTMPEPKSGFIRIEGDTAVFVFFKPVLRTKSIKLAVTDQASYCDLVYKLMAWEDVGKALKLNKVVAAKFDGAPAECDLLA